MRATIRTLPTLLAAAALALPAATVEAQEALPAHAVAQFGAPPPIPDGPLSEDLEDALDAVVAHSLNQSRWAPDEPFALEQVAASGDPRLAWTLTDMMRFSWRTDFRAEVAATAAALLGIEFETAQQWHELTDALIAWDVPDYPGYLEDKRAIYTNYVPGWDALMVEGDIDWPRVSWGGVRIDARPPFETDRGCDCIPAVDAPEVETAAEATWLDDDDVVFGIVLGGEARAYPRRIMEIREMVNDTLGGRDLGIPYCTLCGAAQAYLTDEVPDGVERPILRTSGLLIRSNKVMYDVVTQSVFDTFTGAAVTGPLHEKGVRLRQASVVTTEWGAWKAAHPDTTVLVESLALGRDFDLRNTRDANGPIFPVGDVDPRLPIQEDVVGVVTPEGRPIAFRRSAAAAALAQGGEVALEGVRLVEEGGGLRAVAEGGTDLGSHQAFWFAWSQFHPETALWPADG